MWAGVTVARASARQAGGPEPLLLETLRLSQNNLSGQLPPLMPFRNLRVLDLSSNSLSGTLAGQSFHHLAMCETINLEHNRFSGPLPSAALTNLVNLQVRSLTRLHDRTLLVSLLECMCFSTIRSPGQTSLSVGRCSGVRADGMRTTSGAAAGIQ